LLRAALLAWCTLLALRALLGRDENRACQEHARADTPTLQPPGQDRKRAWTNRILPPSQRGTSSAARHADRLAGPKPGTSHEWPSGAPNLPPRRANLLAANLENPCAQSSLESGGLRWFLS
jgi:hypothetical protein